MLAFAVSGHFALAVASAANIPVAKMFGKNHAAGMVMLYAYLTGTGNYFGFFAPGVISQLQVDYSLYSHGVSVGQGKVLSDNPEISLRLHNLIQKFWPAPENADMRRSLAASLAGRLLADSKQADEVAITIRAFVLPSMAQYRAGMRPSWETSYVGTFRRDALK